MIDAEKRCEVCARADGYCEVCGILRPEHGPWGVRGECAHVVAKTKWALRRYGEVAIDHVDNLRWTCPGKCNDAVLITLRTAERERHVASILDKLTGKPSTTVEFRLASSREV